jgi:hypothetical protein
MEDVENLKQYLFNKAKELNIDIEEILRAFYAFKSVNKRKGSRVKQLLTMVSLTALVAVLIIFMLKAYPELHKEKKFKKKVKSFIKSLNIDKIKESDIVKQIKEEVKVLME